MTEIIWLNVLIVGLIAAAAAVVLYFTAKKFAVENNPLADKIDALLPQANCGACGKAGCRDFANACAAAEQHAAELTSFPDQMIFVIDHIIEALRADTLMLRFLERSFVWPGLDQIEASGEAEPLMRKLLNVVLTSPEMAGRTEREIYQRITALGSMCISVCYTSVLEGKPDNIDNMKPILYDIIRRAL